jgi:hypothetical protein
MTIVITDQQLYTQPIEIGSKALVWVIDEDCLYDSVVAPQFLPMFLEHDNTIDVSDQYPEHNGISVRFIKNNEILGDIQASEYFGSILLSNPIVIDLSQYPYGKHVVSPYAKFNGEKFIILGMNENDISPWRER